MKQSTKYNIFYLLVFLWPLPLGLLLTIGEKLHGASTEINSMYGALKPIIYTIIPIALAIYCIIRFIQERRYGESKAIYLLVLLLCIPAEILVIDRNNADDYVKFNKELVKEYGQGYVREKYWKEKSITYHLIGNVRRNKRIDAKKEAEMLEKRNTD